MEPKDLRRRLLSLEPSAVSQEEGEESRERCSVEGAVVKRGRAGFWCEGAEGVTEAMVRERALYKGPQVWRTDSRGKYLGVGWKHRDFFFSIRKNRKEIRASQKELPRIPPAERV